MDSHMALPELKDELKLQLNALPFVALSNEDRLVMVAHLKTPSTGLLPASLHRGSVAENPWGVRGRFLPDDLDMGGCTDWSWEDRVRLCLEAGHEWLLICQSEQGVRACANALAKQPQRLKLPALERSRSMRNNLPRPQPGPLDLAAWKAWVEQVRRWAVGSGL